MTDRRRNRLLRLGEELRESGLPGLRPVLFDLVVEEVDQALRPAIHERRVPSTGTILRPTVESSSWATATGLTIIRTAVKGQSLADARRFSDGLSSWLLRRRAGDNEWLMFDRPAGSERDAVVLAGALGAILVQRHPSGTVRIVGDFGVLRTEGYDWHLEPPVSTLMEHVVEPEDDHASVVKSLLAFAIHDLGSGGVGALLVLSETFVTGTGGEERLPTPPPLRIDTPFHLAALRHALSQVDGAAVFDFTGTLRQLGVRLVPSLDAEGRIDPIGGTRHTAARLFSYDDPAALVVAVSEDGPVSIFRAGQVLGPRRSGTTT